MLSLTEKVVNYVNKYSTSDGVERIIEKSQKNEIIELLVNLSIILNVMESEDVQNLLIEQRNINILSDAPDNSRRLNIIANIYFKFLIENYDELKNFEENIKDPIIKTFINFSPLWVASHYKISKKEMKNAFKEKKFEINENDIMLFVNNYTIVSKSLLRYYYPNMFSEDNSSSSFKKQSWETLGSIFVKHDLSEIADHYYTDRNLFNSTNFMDIFTKNTFDNVQISEEFIPDYISDYFEKLGPYINDVVPFQHKLDQYMLLTDARSENSKLSDGSSVNVVYEVIEKNFAYKVKRDNIKKYDVKHNKNHQNSNDFFYVILVDYFKENEEMGEMLIDIYRNNKMENNKTRTEFFQLMMNMIIGYKYATLFVNPIIYQMFDVDSIDFGNFSIKYLYEEDKFLIQSIKGDISYKEINKIAYKEKIFLNEEYYQKRTAVLFGNK